jgi:hypothetical protein
MYCLRAGKIQVPERRVQDGRMHIRGERKFIKSAGRVKWKKMMVARSCSTVFSFKAMKEYEDHFNATAARPQRAWLRDYAW